MYSDVMPPISIEQERISLSTNWNAVEPGSEVPIHRHPTKDESFVILRGKVRSTTYNDDGSIIDSVVLSQEDGVYGVDILKGVWHKLESLEPNSVIFECKEGPFVPHEIDGIADFGDDHPGISAITTHLS